MAYKSDRRINLVLAAVAVGSVALMVILSIHGLDERARAREIARMPVVTFEAVNIVAERPATASPSTQVARTQATTNTVVR